MNTYEFLLNCPINGFSFTHPTTAFLNSTNFVPETSMSIFATCCSFERKEARRNETDTWQRWNLRISHMHNNSSLYRQARGPLAKGHTANERPLPFWLQVQTPSKPLLVYTECPCSSQWYLSLTTWVEKWSIYFLTHLCHWLSYDSRGHTVDRAPNLAQLICIQVFVSSPTTYKQDSEI